MIFSVNYASTASEIWSDLLERFGKESAPRAYELKQTLTATHKNGSSISRYYTKLKGIWDDMQWALRTVDVLAMVAYETLGRVYAN